MAFLLHHLLSESAAKYPNKEAVIFHEQIITYGELESSTNQLAHELLAQGIKKGSRVGIYMNRCIYSIIAACGILKAGAAYVPIDPMSPSERLNYIVHKCDITALLTFQGKLHTIEQTFPAPSPLQKIFVMDSEHESIQSLGEIQVFNWHVISEKPTDRVPEVGSIDSDIAYILFTSGSTGNPKGVMISHLNSLTFINSAYNFFQIHEEDRLSNNSPLHFDLSVFDIFVAFKAAASVVIVPETIAIFPVKLAEFIAMQKISVWNSVPSTLSLLATYKNFDTHNFSNLRLILFAGEVFPLKYLRRLKTSIPSAKFYNMYGQTEANSSLYYLVNHIPSDDTETIPIGQTFPNFDVFALDEKNQRISTPGEKGELYIRGASVALGYWGETDKTQASFVKNPLSSNKHEKVYKTGDLVTLDTEGNYLFLGRKDHMIKSRGYRIELGEIEAAIASHELVKSTVVIPIPDDLIGNRIAAVVVPVTTSILKKEELIRFCAQRLPKYMLPETIEFRDSLPMTSSGKFDRKELGVTMSQLHTCLKEKK